VPLLLTLLEGEVYAYRDGCPPGSALTLQLGRVEGTTLVCPWHGCRYDLRTGRREDAEGKLSVLPVAVQDGEVKIALGTEEVGPE
jgi:nitrite reductase/ring-hydroxylating ferredoxin subunit